MKKLLLGIFLLFSLSLSFVSADDDEYPFIISDTSVYFSNYDEPITVDYILSTLVATDDKDGNISDLIIVFSDTYTGNEQILGDHMLSFEVTDSNNQSTRSMIIVRVSDITSPVIHGVVDYEIDIDHEEIDFQTNITAIDNYDGELTSNLLIVGDDLVDYSRYGTYDISYIIMDSSGNNTLVLSTVTIKDTVHPEIIGIEHIVKHVDDLLTLEDIASRISASDNLDGDITSMLLITEDLYTGFGATPGEYSVTYSIVDSAGNVAEHQVLIEVKSDIPKILYFDNSLLQLNRDEILTTSDLEQLLTSVGELDQYSDYSLQVIKDEYTPNQTSSGEYQYNVRFISNSGEVVLKNLIIAVDFSTELPIFEGDLVPDPNPVAEHFSSYWRGYFVGGVAIIALAGVIKFKP